MSHDVPTLSLIATACFALAIVHTFFVNRIQKLSHQFPAGSFQEVTLHLLGEVELSFALWASVFVLAIAVLSGPLEAWAYVTSRHFTEPAFVFVIMAVCSTRAIHGFASTVLSAVASLIPIPRGTAFYITALSLGPLLGSLITEPAAMTVTVLILIERFYSRQLSTGLMYATLGLLFVNVSIGGTLTPYAAPPVLMVAGRWGWDLSFMLSQFGWKAALACVTSTCLTALWFRRELNSIPDRQATNADDRLPLWITALHLGLLAAIVAFHQSALIFFSLFLLFLAAFFFTKRYQSALQLRGGILVGAFLAGIVILGEPQSWWLEPLLRRLDSLALFIGSAALTSITDNAALTYLGAQIEGLSRESQYALVAGSVVGGGLTVIANAPNPVGYGLLSKYFGENGISPAKLFIAALPYTVLAGAFFWLF